MGEDNISIFLVFFAALLATVLVLSKYLHDSRLSNFLPEAAMILLIGMVAGYLIHLTIGKRYVAATANANNNNNYYNYNDDDDVNNNADNNNYDDAVNDDDINAKANNYDNNEQVDLAALLSFDPDIFFVFLLPPIIFNTGLRIGPLFFRHIVPICVFAVIGTCISAITTALLLWGVVKAGLVGNFDPSLAELLTFGALISSTDPVSTLAVFQMKRVDPRLFYLCFGESVLNDALAIVLFYSFGKFVTNQDVNAHDTTIAFGEFFIDLFLNCVGSLVLGGLGGIMAAFLFKQIDMRRNRLVEISVYVLLMYIPFLIAEILHVSGIVTILFTGITANRYVVPNLSNITKVNADMIFRLGAHLAETSIFLELGLSVFGMIGHWNWNFIAWSLLACLVGRALNVFPLSFIFNTCLVKYSSPSPTSSAYWSEFRRGVYPTTTPPPPPTTTTTTPGRIKPHGFPETFRKPGTSERRATFENPGIMMLPVSADGGGGGGEGGGGGVDIPVGHNLNNTERSADQVMAPRNDNMSFGAESCATEATATPWERKDLKIRMNTAIMLWVSGLRGAVAYACVRTFPNALGHQKDFAMTTMAVILITTFVLGTTTPLALHYLDIDTGVDEKKYMKDALREPIVSNWILKFEQRFIKPCVIRDFSIMESIRGDVQRAHEMALSPMSRREHLHIEPKIEMTESGYLEACDLVPENDETSLEKLVRTDSLFDYGAY